MSLHLTLAVSSKPVSQTTLVPDQPHGKQPVPFEYPSAITIAWMVPVAAIAAAVVIKVKRDGLQGLFGR